MIAHHIHAAPARVRAVRRQVIDGQRFRGYSSVARMAGGLSALTGTAVLSSGLVFGVGELAGGLVLHPDHTRRL